MGFEGELLASGEYLPDQVSFLKRVGFDSFVRNGGTNEVPDYYSGFYQPDTDDSHVSIREVRMEQGE